MAWFMWGRWSCSGKTLGSEPGWVSGGCGICAILIFIIYYLPILDPGILTHPNNGFVQLKIVYKRNSGSVSGKTIFTQNKTKGSVRQLFK